MSDKYNPDKHHRQSIRLQGWDYTTPGAYFITICTYQRACLFEDSRLRDLAENGWRNIPTQPHAKHVILDEWVVMPNHLHGILILSAIETDVDTGEEAEQVGLRVLAENQDVVRPISPLPPRGVEAGSVGAIVGNFKSLVARRANNLRRSPGAKVWQRGYYDRIVRNERELDAIRQYIWDNPRRWAEDRDNLDALLTKMRLVVG
jgi:REP element-mobilizing transposase RayT